jgi:uncharacterized protein YdeI (YjbR/CyaY-like superfamily)
MLVACLKIRKSWRKNFMPIDPITWVIIIGSFLARSTVGYFWDEIREWASRMLGYILDAINDAIEVRSDAVVYLVKEKTLIYRQIEVLSRHIYTGATTRHVKREEITRDQIPSDLNNQLDEKMRLKLMQQQT